MVTWALRIGAASLSVAWRARVPVVTERNSTKLDRSMQKMVIEAPYLKFKQIEERPSGSGRKTAIFEAEWLQRVWSVPA